MSTTRADVLAALRQIKQPVSATELASRMGRTRATVRDILATLAAMGRIERQQHVSYKRQFVYRAKEVEA
jgi:predicted transcriptional regulator